MKPTKRHSIDAKTLAVDINGAAELLSCGITTARKLLKDANARIPVSGKRALYSVKRIEEYIEKTTRDTDKEAEGQQ